MTHFDAAASEWDSEEKIKLMQTLAHKTLSLIDIEEKTNILDFGCGTGLFGLEFFDRAKSLVGIDTSKGMLQVFNDKTKEYSNISSHCGDIENYKADRQFGLIVSSMTFHHLAEPSEILQVLKNLLEANGSIAVIDLVEEDGTFHPDNDKMGVKHFGFSQEKLKSWAETLGFKFSYQEINRLEKNGREYAQFLAIYSI